MFRKARRLHFVGIGGSGMSGIAEVLVNLGYRVTGSDLAAGEVTRRLKRLGARVFRGHKASNVSTADVVVVSSAVKADNPEVVEARRRRIPVIPRAEMLAEIMRLKYGVAVGGRARKDVDDGHDRERADGRRTRPDGGHRRPRQGAALRREGGPRRVHGRRGRRDRDGSFLKMKPTIAVVTNIDREHLDHYADLGEIQDAFSSSLARVPFYGAAVVCLDDPNLRAILPRVDRKLVTYGFSTDADLVAAASGARRLPVPFQRSSGGLPARHGGARRARGHSVANALAAIAVGIELDVPFPRSRRRWRVFTRSTAGSRRGAKRSGRRSSTTTAITRPRSRRPSRRRARDSAAARWSSSSRTATRAPAPSWRSSDGPSSSPITSSSPRSTPQGIPPSGSRRPGGRRRTHAARPPLRRLRAAPGPGAASAPADRAQGRPRRYARRGRRLEGGRGVSRVADDGGGAPKTRRRAG